MKVAYIAHPIAGDVSGNLEKVKQIVRTVNLYNKNVVPFVPYFADCQALDDSHPVERERGISNNIELLKRGFVDELWLCGDRISSGMEIEIEVAIGLKIPVVCYSPKMAELYESWLHMQLIGR